MFAYFKCYLNARIDVSEEIDANETRVSEECDVCHYWYLSNKGFKFEPNVCNNVIIY